jgi:hypothetical protein
LRRWFVAAGVAVGNKRRRKHMNLAKIGLIGLLTFALAPSLAVASSVHLKGGGRAKPTFTDLGLTLNATGALSGLGNGDVLVTLAAMADPQGRCCNPGGQCQVPGQNPAPVAVTGSEAIPAGAIKNGTTPFDVTTTPPVTPIAGAPDCPNTSWTESIVDMAFTSAVITVEQPVGTTVLTVSCAISPPTSDGTVPAGTVTCVSSN